MSSGRLFAFYRSAQWQHVSDAYRRKKNYTCERCGQPGSVVHHKQRLTLDNVSDTSISCSFDNLELLCRDCHEREHGRQKQEPRRSIVFDSSGRPCAIHTSPPGPGIARPLDPDRAYL